METPTEPPDPSSGHRPRVALALGSNLGDRLGHLVRGVRGLCEELEVERVSSVYESDPVGYRDQPPFLNAVMIAESALVPLALLELCHAVEAGERRTRDIPSGPRTLDVDIVLMGEAVLDEPELTVPHPRWSRRAFVLAPLAEVAPHWMDPVSGRSVQEIWLDRKDDLPPATPVAPPEALWRSCS